MAKEYKTIAAAQKAGSMYFTGKDGKKKLAVTKEQLDAWKKRNKGKFTGSALTAWANAKGKDIKGDSKRDSSPRPMLRPGSESAGPGMGVMTKAEADEVDAANKRNKEVREEMGKLPDRAEKTREKYEEDKAASRERRGPSAGEKFNTWYEKNGDKYNTMKEAMEAYQSTLRSGNSKGGMQMKQGRYNKGGMADYRKSGMFYGGMAKKR